VWRPSLLALTAAWKALAAGLLPGAAGTGARSRFTVIRAPGLIITSAVFDPMPSLLAVTA
jgi:hypothetical protein